MARASLSSPNTAAQLAPVRPHSPRRLRRAVASALVALALCAQGAVLAQPAAALDDPAIEASSVLLVDPESGVTLYENNADGTAYPASLTKIMTALVVLENADLSTQVTVTKADLEPVTPESSVAGFKEGEELTIEQLLYGLLLPSGNDASYILARAVGGTVDNFVAMMNEKAAEIGCTGTHFSNPCGLHADDHYTTARDLYLMETAAMANETFAQIVSTPSYDMPETNKQDARELENTNQLLDPSSSVYYEPCTGIKTGNTDEAGRCLAGSAEQDDVTLYSVVLGAADADIPESLTETKRLFEWAYANFSMTDLVDRGEAVETVDVVDAENDEQLEIGAATALEGLLPNDVAPEDIEVTYDLPETIEAPVAQGEKLGTVTYSYNGQTYGTVELVANNDVNIAPLAWLRNTAQEFIAIREVRIGLAVGGCALIALIVFLIVRGVRKRHARQEYEKRLADIPYGMYGAAGSAPYAPGAPVGVGEDAYLVPISDQQGEDAAPAAADPTPQHIKTSAAAPAPASQPIGAETPLEGSTQAYTYESPAPEAPKTPPSAKGRAKRIPEI